MINEGWHHLSNSSLHCSNTCNTANIPPVPKSTHLQQSSFSSIMVPSWHTSRQKCPLKVSWRSFRMGPSKGVEGWGIHWTCDPPPKRGTLYPDWEGQEPSSQLLSHRNHSREDTLLITRKRKIQTLCAILSVGYSRLVQLKGTHECSPVAEHTSS
jgi:hypothetical protein